MCKEWTKLFSETNLLHLDNYKGVKEKCNEDEVGIGEIVKIDEYWTVPYPLTHNLLENRRAFGFSSQQWRNPEILKNAINNNLKN